MNEKRQGAVEGVNCIRYRVQGDGADGTHPFARTFESAVRHAEGVHRALKLHPEIRPDVIVGHSGFGSTALLPELTGAPIVNHFEFFYRTKGADVDYRPDFPVEEATLLRARFRNAMILTDLDACAAGYSPTPFQRSLFPAEYLPKIEVLHDGIDTEFWKPRAPSSAGAPRTILGEPVPDGVRVVTYVSRGFESLRGFDIFVKAAKLILGARRDVLFVVVGQDRIVYGGDERFTGGKTFREWCLERDPLDLSRVRFAGHRTPEELAEILAVSDLHVYLTVPFVLSWSMLNAMSCGATVLASDTAPVRDFIEHGRNGLLAPFFEPEAFAEQAIRVLDDPAAFRPLGESARGTVLERASLDVCHGKLRSLLERVAGREPRGARPS